MAHLLLRTLIWSNGMKILKNYSFFHWQLLTPFGMINTVSIDVNSPESTSHLDDECYTELHKDDIMDQSPPPVFL